MTMTNKHAERLRARIQANERPRLPYHLWNALDRAVQLAKEEPQNPYFRALVTAGIVSPKGHLLEPGHWYRRTINGLRKPRQFNKCTNGSCRLG